MVESQIDCSDVKHNTENDNSNGKFPYKKGDIIELGGFDGKPIEWIVVDIDKKDHLLWILSKEGLEVRPYHSERESVTWENCTLRQYLNNEFINACFDIQERKKIVETMIWNKDNYGYGTLGGNNTRDRVFLLSIDEIKELFDNAKACRCIASEYANRQGAFVNEELGTSAWWLRSPGCNDYYAAIVGSDGLVNGICMYVFVLIKDRVMVQRAG